MKIGTIKFGPKGVCWGYITVGNYTVYDWNEVHFNDNGSDPGTYIEWQRQITKTSSDLNILAKVSVYPSQDEWYVHFNSKDYLFNEYMSMFHDQGFHFYSAMEAKDHVDFFLDKLKKLKAFL